MLSVFVDLSGRRKVPRSHSYQDVNGSTADSQNTRLLLEEKEQALLASQETVQASKNFTLANYRQTSRHGQADC